MPLVRIALRAGKSLEYRKSIADAVHHALMKEINVPEKDRFQIITEHDADSLIYEPDYLDIHRTDDVLFIQITISQGRSVELRKNLFRTIANPLPSTRAFARKMCSSI